MSDWGTPGITGNPVVFPWFSRRARARENHGNSTGKPVVPGVVQDREILDPGKVGGPPNFGGGRSRSPWWTKIHKSGGPDFRPRGCPKLEPRVPTHDRGSGRPLDADPSGHGFSGPGNTANPPLQAGPQHRALRREHGKTTCPRQRYTALGRGQDSSEFWRSATSDRDVKIGPYLFCGPLELVKFQAASILLAPRSGRQSDQQPIVSKRHEKKDECRFVRSANFGGGQRK